MRQLISQVLAAFTRLLYKRTILFLVLLLCAGVAGALWNMSRLSINLIESQARPDLLSSAAVGSSASTRFG